MSDVPNLQRLVYDVAAAATECNPIAVTADVADIIGGP